MKMISINNRRYIGAKTKMLSFIDETMKKENIEFDTFLDLFGGTGVVGDYFNNCDKTIIVNDVLESNYISYKAWFGCEEYDSAKLCNYISKYNSLDELDDNYFSNNFSDTYFSKDNCKKIGFIREDIENSYKCEMINDRERAILITSLLYAMDKIANTVGHYDAYRKNGDLNKVLEMCMLDLKPCSNNVGNQIFNKDSNELVKEIYSDVVYIDPPYNSRQYSDAYHLLENVALWEKQEVYGVAKKFKRTKGKSKYCSVSAPLVFKDLIENINAKYIIVSYNNMGNKGAGRSQAKLDDKDIISTLSKKGKLSIYETDFKQFNTGKTNINGHKERLFVCKVGDNDSSNILNKKYPQDDAKSPLNYTGGKFRLLPQIKPFFPRDINVFIDMFSGGCNVGINSGANEVYCIDKQKEVIRIMKLFKDFDCSYIIDTIDKIIEFYNLSNSAVNGYEYYNCKSDTGLGSYNKNNYLKLRDDYNNLEDDTIEKDFMFLTLVIFGFNNQIRFNSTGNFNMPVGKRDFNNSVRKNLEKFVLKIQGENVSFINDDFRNIILDSNENILLYCDPPYFLGTASYNESNGWLEKDEVDLLEYLKNASECGVRFALSNVIKHKGQTNTILEQWIKDNNFVMHILDFNYNNSNYHKNMKENDNKETLEVLITNY